jgi:thiol:disulfide interchange protein
MPGRKLVWVDVGMAVAVGGFIALVAFGRNSSSYVPLMIAFAIALVVWAFVAEFAAVKSEAAQPDRSRKAAARTSTEPLAH